MKPASHDHHWCQEKVVFPDRFSLHAIQLYIGFFTNGKTVFPYRVVFPDRVVPDKLHCTTKCWKCTSNEDENHWVPSFISDQADTHTSEVISTSNILPFYSFTKNPHKSTSIKPPFLIYTIFYWIVVSAQIKMNPPKVIIPILKYLWVLIQELMLSVM